MSNALRSGLLPATPVTSLLPVIAYLHLGLLVALVYATKRARLAQHRGLTLVSMAVDTAATFKCPTFVVSPMGGLERGDDLQTQISVFVGPLGAALRALGSGRLAKEIEGDDAHTGSRITAGR
jgi:hypothetical protein